MKNSFSRFIVAGLLMSMLCLSSKPVYSMAEAPCTHHHAQSLINILRWGQDAESMLYYNHIIATQSTEHVQNVLTHCDDNHWTVFLWAASRGHTDLITHIIEYPYYKPTSSDFLLSLLTHTDTSNNNALCQALYWNRISTITLLLSLTRRLMPRETITLFLNRTNKVGTSIMNQAHAQGRTLLEEWIAHLDDEEEIMVKPAVD